MPVLTKFQDFVPVGDKQRVLNHAWLAQGIGTTDFYFIQVDPATGNFPVAITPTARAKAWNAFLDYSSSNVGTGAYVTVLAAASNPLQSTRLLIFDSGGNPMIIATGTAGSEVVQFYVAQGGCDRIDDSSWNQDCC